MIWITQVLCPQRHCVIGTAWDDAEWTAKDMEASVMEQFKQFVNAGTFNPYCGLCRSELLQPESAPTRWSTLAEALPHIRELEKEQMIVAAAAASKVGSIQ